MSLFSEDEKTRISGAIASAETRTSGEIVAVVAGESDSYLFVGLTWAAILALLTPLPLIYATSWSVQHIYIAQLAVFLCAGLAVQVWPVRLALVPRALKRARAHRHAVEQFLAQNLHTTKSRTGVLIFVSVAERYAEVIADQGIYAKAPRERWDDIVAKLTDAIGRGEAADGFVAAIEASGALLAEHFPRGTGDSDELPNHLIEL